MKMSETQKKLREWFRRHRWHTVQTISGHGFYLESPIHHQSGALRVAVNPKTGKEQYYEDEAVCTIDLDDQFVNMINLGIYMRKVWLCDSADGSVHRFAEEDFDEWPDYNDACHISLPAEDFLKLAELIKAAQADSERFNASVSKKWLAYTKRMAKTFTEDWIGRNASYENIKRRYSSRSN